MDLRHALAIAVGWCRHLALLLALCAPASGAIAQDVSGTVPSIGGLTLAPTLDAKTMRPLVKQQQIAIDEAKNFARQVAGDPGTAEYSALFRARLSQLLPFYTAHDRKARTISEHLAKPIYANLDSVAVIGDRNLGDPVVPGAASTTAASLIDRDPRYQHRADASASRVGGFGAIESQYDNVVAIITEPYEDGYHLCSGTVIGAHEVLTARHCVCHRVNAVLSGKRIRTQPTDRYQAVNYAMIGHCPTPDDEFTDADPDVAVVYVDHPFPDAIVKLTSFVASGPAEGDTVLAVGFGVNTRFAGNDNVGIQMSAPIEVVSPMCSGQFDYAGQHYTDTGYYLCHPGWELVAGNSTNRDDTCNGDSGGPIFKIMGDGRLALLAMTDRGLHDKTTGRTFACGAGGIYVRVDGVVLKWIRDTLQVGVRTASADGPSPGKR